MGRGVCLSARLSVPCLNITRSRTDRNLLRGQNSKVKVIRQINAHTVYAKCLPNGKAYEFQTWYTDGAVTFKVKGQGRMVT